MGRRQRKGPIPVWTDGGQAFTFDFDGTTPFITIERANEITQFAFDQWNDVPTATFAAKIAGTIESQTGIADVTGANAAQIYEKQNGYGFWVLYDTDGAILEEYFGVPKWAVLGIAFPEWADENGRITEATAVLNGWYVDAGDTEGNYVAGVFTHEFGHAINLSHSQVNGPMVYSSYPFDGFRRHPGVPGCVDPVYAWNWYDDSVKRADPLLDAVSAMTGDRTQSRIGPDGRFTIRNLTPGQDYLLYIEEIVAGGYPTAPQMLISQRECWNAGESSNPATDRPCDATPIRAQAGVTETADITVNGYAQGVCSSRRSARSPGARTCPA